MRADAQDNRRALLDAAREVFVEEGTSVALDKIARRAGVGIGTLYRRFPDRDALLRGVLVDLFEAMSAGAREAEVRAAAYPDGPAAWELLVRTLADLGLGPALPIIMRERFDLIDDPLVATSMRQAIDAVEAVYRSAQAAGHLRSDVSVLEIQLLAGTLSQSRPTRPPTVDPDLLADRLVGVLIDGLRARPGNSGLPGEPTVFSPLNAEDRAAVVRAIEADHQRRAKGPRG